MKKFKKLIILSIAIVGIISCFIYEYLNNDIVQVVEEDIFVEENEKITGTNIIILHITGEVNSPRNC